MVNRASIERGLGRVTHFIVKSVSAAGGSSGDVESFCYPTEDVHALQLGCNYDTVKDGNGLPEPGTILMHKDCLVGKVANLALSSGKNSKKIRVCRSVIYEGPDFGVVDSVVLTVDLHGNQCVVVKIRCTYNLMEGDKMSSRYGKQASFVRVRSFVYIPFIIRPEGNSGSNRCPGRHALLPA